MASPTSRFISTMDIVSRKNTNTTRVNQPKQRDYFYFLQPTEAQGSSTLFVVVPREHFFFTAHRDLGFDYISCAVIQFDPLPLRLHRGEDVPGPVPRFEPGLEAGTLTTRPPHLLEHEAQNKATDNFLFSKWHLKIQGPENVSVAVHFFHYMDYWKKQKHLQLIKIFISEKNVFVCKNIL